MKYSAAAVATIMASLSAAQGVEDIAGALPQCAMQCVMEGIQGSDCDMDDSECICNDLGSLSEQISPCLEESSCDEEEISSLFTSAEQACAQEGTSGSVELPNPTDDGTTMTLPVESSSAIASVSSEISSASDSSASASASASASGSATRSADDSSNTGSNDSDSDSDSSNDSDSDNNDDESAASVLKAGAGLVAAAFAAVLAL